MVARVTALTGTAEKHHTSEDIQSRSIYRIINIQMFSAPSVPQLTLNLSSSFFREKYLNTLIKVEMMLKLWFPQIPTLPVSAAPSIATSPARSLQETSSSTPPHKHRDQLHIPVKVRIHAFLCAQLDSCHHHNFYIHFQMTLLSPAHFPEAQTKLDRYGHTHAFPGASQVPSYQRRREEGETRSR